jgi:outer membrane protein OmpA-like peptidoglycan-associated protein
MTTFQKLTRPVVPVMIVSMAAMSSGCQTTTTATDGRGTKGATIGAVGGAVLGGIIGSATGSWAKGALLGAVIGGGAGALIGNYMDRQAAEIDRSVEGAQVERVGEGIRVVFDTGLLFSTGSSTLTPASRTNISKLAGILNKYKDTNLVIEGHTDNVGSEATNMTLSERRAQSVSSLLRAYNVSGNRLTTVGYGETRPVATNETDAGRRLNRRVEVLIFANDNLKKQAQSGELKM